MIELMVRAGFRSPQCVSVTAPCVLGQDRRQQTARIETLEKQVALMALVRGRLERAGMLTSVSFQLACRAMEYPVW